mmetsp:Transcript_116024/g.213201  ORF Transcript_116024/g.213201 Transcript_116024/m.213201 type:complete len:279 (-) Transcript_116024:2135-2971(-)
MLQPFMPHVLSSRLAILPAYSPPQLGQDIRPGSISIGAPCCSSLATASSALPGTAFFGALLLLVTGVGHAATSALPAASFALPGTALLGALPLLFTGVVRAAPSPAASPAASFALPGTAPLGALPPLLVTGVGHAASSALPAGAPAAALGELLLPATCGTVPAAASLAANAAASRWRCSALSSSSSRAMVSAVNSMWQPMVKVTPWPSSNVAAAALSTESSTPSTPAWCAQVQRSSSITSGSCATNLSPSLQGAQAAVRESRPLRPFEVLCEFTKRQR